MRGAHATLTEDAGGLTIVIPARRHPFLVLYVAFCLAVWTFAEIAMVRTLVAGPAPGFVTLAVTGCLLVWTAFGAAVLAACLWLAAGRTVVSVTDRALTIRCEALGLGTNREYDTAHVHALRLAPWWIFNPWPGLGFMFRLWPGAGPIALDYGARTVRFGNGLEESEARRIMDRIAARLGIPAGEAAVEP